MAPPTAALAFSPGDKYAIVVLPRLPLDSAALPTAAELAPGLWFTRTLPIQFAAHWTEWIGSVRAKQLAKAQLALVAVAPSKSPDILDGENVHLLGRVGRLYQGLQMAVPFWVEGEVIQLTGAHRGDNADVRQISTMTAPAGADPGQVEVVDFRALRRAAEIAAVLSEFPPGQFLQLCRVLNAFYSGLSEHDLRQRLHQFCRCIEGLILADPGQTTRQFKSRTELFVGPSHHEFMGSIYENRSAVEHMNDPVLPGASDAERRKAFIVRTLAAEAIARHCLNRVLLSPTLLPCFTDEKTLASLWALPDSEKKSLWGQVFNLDGLLKALENRRLIGRA